MLRILVISWGISCDGFEGKLSELFANISQTMKRREQALPQMQERKVLENLTISIAPLIMMGVFVGIGL